MITRRLRPTALTLLLAVSFAAPSGAQAASADGFTYDVTGASTATVTGCAVFCPAALTIPDTLGGYSVTNIGNSAFAYTALTTLTIGDSVTSIGNYAFYGNALTTLVIPDSVTSIAAEAFAYNLLTTVTFLGNAPTDVADAFKANAGLTQIMVDYTATGWSSTWSGILVVVTITDFTALANSDAADAIVTYTAEGTTVTLGTSGQVGDGTITFTESDDDCSISGSTLTIVQVGDGSCVVTATLAASADYPEATDTVAVVIAKAAATLSFTTPADVTFGVSPFGLVATASNPDSSTVTFTVGVGSLAVCSVSGSTVTVSAAGSCTITASGAATANYLAATPVTTSFTVSPADARATATLKPTVSGTARVGKSLTAAKGTWTGYPTPTFTYQWYACTTAVSAARATVPATCKKITSATRSTFKLTAAQRGKYIAVFVKGTSLRTTATTWLSKTTTKVR